MAGLLPCPFCGSTDLKLYVTGAVGAYRRGVVRCKACGARVEAESGGYHDYPHDEPRETYDMANADARELVAEKWNRRAESTCHIDTPIIDWGTGETDFKCSSCGFSADPQYWAETYDHCPRCGARVVCE